MFKGSFVALITPFRDGAVDETAFQEHVAWQIGQGTHGLVPIGTTGECPALEDDEQKRLIALTVEVAKGRAPVIAGTGFNSTTPHDRRDARRQGGRRRCGADRLPLLQQADAGRPLPAFQGGARRGRPADRHLQHSRAQRRRHDERDDGAAGEIAEHRRGQGRDQRPGPAARGCGSRSTASSRLLSGEDATAVAYLAQGGDGCISVTANVAPALCSEMHEAWQKGDFATVRRINERLIPLHDALFVETSPAPVKYAASLLGRCTAGGAPAAVADDAGDAGEGARRDARRRAAQLGRGERGPGGDDAGDRPLRRAEPPRPARLPDRGQARSRARAARHRGQGAAPGRRQHRRGLCRRSRRRALSRQRQHPRIQGRLAFQP